MKQSYNYPLDKRLIAILEPLPDYNVVEWCEENVVLPQSVSPKPGKLRVQPWFKELLNLLDNNNIDNIVVMSSTRMGKTTLEMLYILYCMAVWDAPALFVMPTADEAFEILKDRIRPIIVASPELDKIFRKGKAYDIKDRLYGINSILHLGWARSASSLASIDAKLVLCDEVGKYSARIGEEAGAIDLAQSRLNNYRGAGGKAIYCSTPVSDQDPFYHQYDLGLKHKWFFECPLCKQLSCPIFRRLKWSEDSLIADLENGKGITYQCENCEGHIKESQFKRAIRIGKWQIDDPDAGKKSGKSVSYHLHGLLSEMSWGHIVGEFLKGKKILSKNKNFINSILGEPWVSKEIKMNPEAFDPLILKDPALSVPLETLEIVAGLDPGGATKNLEKTADNPDCLHFWVTILACLPGNRYQVIATDRFMGWAETHKYLNRPMYDANDKEFHVSTVYCDSGWATDAIHNLAVNHGVVPVDDQMKGEIVRVAAVETMKGDWGKRKTFAGKIMLATINKQLLLTKFWQLIADANIHFNDGLHDDTYKHYLAWKKKEDRRPGKQGYVFVEEWNGIDDHLLACIVYSLAASHAHAHYQYNTFQEWQMIHEPEALLAKEQQDQPEKPKVPIMNPYTNSPNTYNGSY